jgi:hypothetical protein
MHAAIVALVLISVASCVTLTACGSSTTTQVQTSTTGQQLIDLKKAFDEGVITKSEYDRKHREILHHH